MARGGRQAHHARLPAAAPCPHLRAGAPPSLRLPRGVSLIRGRCGCSRSPLYSCCSSAQVRSHRLSLHHCAGFIRLKNFRWPERRKEPGRRSAPPDPQPLCSFFLMMQMWIYSNLTFINVTVRCFSLQTVTVALRSGAHETIQVSLGTRT